MREPVTVGILVYRSVKWLNFVLESVLEAKNQVASCVFVLANDPTDEIASHPLVHEVFRNPDPQEFYLNRVYRAWNHLVDSVSTPYVALLNSDMYVSDGWLDGLWENRHQLPTSLLVESGRLPSEMPDTVRNLGRTPKEFNREAWPVIAASVREPRISRGKLFMPVLFDVADFKKAGGYPIGNQGQISGDAWFFRKYAQITGRQHVTCHDSVVYHVQEGEMRDGGDGD